MASGMACYHHTSQQAVGQCISCGKAICKDCYDTYGVSVGEYAGKALCYDCTVEQVAENVADVGAFRGQVKKERVIMIIGAVLGTILGIMAGSWVGDVSLALVYAPMFAFFGASLGTIIGFAGAFRNDEGEFGVGSWIVLIASLAVAPIISIYRFVKRVRQIKQADEIIASDERSLQQMRDYFEYTQAMERKADDVDLAKLAEQGSELYNNTYAQSVLKNGEQAAQTELRQSVVTISANGEIIRSFDKKPRRKNEAA